MGKPRENGRVPSLSFKGCCLENCWIYSGQSCCTDLYLNYSVMCGKKRPLQKGKGQYKRRLWINSDMCFKRNGIVYQTKFFYLELARYSKKICIQNASVGLFFSFPALSLTHIQTGHFLTIGSHLVIFHKPQKLGHAVLSPGHVFYLHTAVLAFL